MAEILCGVVVGGEVATAEASCDEAKKRKVGGLRRFRIAAAAVATASEEGGGKRQRVEAAAAAAAIELAVDLKGERCEEEPVPGAVVPADLSPGYGMTSVRGRRRDMEDAVSVRPGFSEKWSFFGVFDGHGCSHVAASCKERMHELVMEEMKEAAGGDSALPLEEEEWKGLMARSFERMDKEVQLPAAGEKKAACRCELHVAKCDHVGSTAVVAVVSPSRIVVANCGDSRAVLCRGGAPIPLSSDHKPDRPDELQRIQDAGGRVIYWDGARVLGVLAMSRAIGDNHLKPYVISEPEVTVTERSDTDECLIIASDGLWDVVSNKTACEVARMCLKGSKGEAAAVAEEEGETDKHGGSDKACLNAAILLTKIALARGTADNVSVVVVDLGRKRSDPPHL